MIWFGDDLIDMVAGEPKMQWDGDEAARFISSNANFNTINNSIYQKEIKENINE